MIENRDFKGVWIPKEIYFNNSLSWTEKILLVEIDSLDKGNGCWASNEHFAKFLGKEVGSIANMMTRLRKSGYIIDVGTDDNKRYIKSTLFTKKLSTPSQKCERPIHKNVNADNITDKHFMAQPSRESINDETPSNTILKKQLVIHTHGERKNESFSFQRIPITDGGEFVNKKSKTSEKTQKYPFSLFWSLYPRKEDKKSALRAWLSLSADKQKLALDDLPSRIKTKKWVEQNGRFVLSAYKYLSGERWEDEISNSITNDKYKKYE